jgi:hypothetical protein
MLVMVCLSLEANWDRRLMGMVDGNEIRDQKQSSNEKMSRQIFRRPARYWVMEFQPRNERTFRLPMSWDITVLTSTPRKRKNSWYKAYLKTLPSPLPLPAPCRGPCHR